MQVIAKREILRAMKFSGVATGHPGGRPWQGILRAIAGILMSEKHLTELPWKVIVTKQGIKDIGLGKALVAYVNIERTKEPAKALEALREISELALKLKKANAGKETVVEHLDEVIK